MLMKVFTIILLLPFIEVVFFILANNFLSFTNIVFIILISGIIGFYNLSDLNLEKNLIQNKNQDMKSLEKKTGLFLQDYFNRIVSNNMYYNPN